MKHYLTHLGLVLIVCTLSATPATAITRTSTACGNWNDASTWNPAGTPACGDSVVVQTTHTISISNQQNYTGCALPLKILVFGKLMFYNGSKLSLPCNSYVIVFPGAVVDHDQGLANSNLINICGIVEWNSNSTLYGLACLPASHPVCAGLLPVTWLDFRAEAAGSANVLLEWQTATETFNHHFEVELSTNGQPFVGVGSLPSLAPGGNSVQQLAYSFVHQKAEKGLSYYRLKQVDMNGDFTYSNIVSVTLDPENKFRYFLYPTLNSGEFTAELVGLRGQGQIKLLVKDPAGATIFTCLQDYEGNSHRMHVSPELPMAPGSYFCVIQVNGEEHRMKFLVGASQ